MTGRTHDLAAFTALNLAIIYLSMPQMSLATAIIAFGMCFIGGLAPDLDKPTSGFWDKIPAGSFFGRILQPFLGKHRHFSHSVLGFCLFSWLLKTLLTLISQIILVDMNIVWWGFVIGYLSHIIMDLLTIEGVPLLLPINYHFGFPPFKFLRIKTGKLMEKLLVFPGLITINIYLIYINYGKYLQFLKSLK